ncbi:MAG: phage terminase large subunit [Vicinamibacterales bacterium]
MTRAARVLLAGLLVAMTATSAVALPSLDDVRDELARKSLRAFVEQGWSIIEPDVPFRGNWHIDAICDHLEALYAGEFDRLLINVPPGCMKSLLVSVFGPTWRWGQVPGARFLTASYSDALTIRDNLKVRDLVRSDWYRRLFPDLAFRQDQNQKIRMDTTEGGWRIATSVGGRATGEHPDGMIVDDPHTAAQAESDPARERANTWIDRTLSTRGVSRRAWLCLIMQRLHQKDATGHVLNLAPKRWVHLCFPMRYEPPAPKEVDGETVLVPRMPTSPLGFQDPRTKDGELLWPSLFPADAVRDLETALGSYGSAGQLQQRPTPAGGGKFQRDWLPIVDAAPAAANVVAKTRGWDVAATENGGDWTAGVRMSRTRDGLYYIEHVVRGRWSSGTVDKTIKQTADTDGPGVRIREEQEPGSSGKTVIDARTITLAGYDYRGKTSTGAKPVRWTPLAVQAEAGNVRLVRGPWNEAFIDELTNVPFADNDDQADAAANAFNDLALGGGGGRVVEVEEG